MRVPKIVWIILITSVILYFASPSSITDTSPKKENTLTHKTDARLEVLSVRKEGDVVVILLLNRGSVEVNQNLIRVETSEVCDFLSPFTVKPGEIVEARYSCPPGEKIKINAPGSRYEAVLR